MGLIDTSPMVKEGAALRQRRLSRCLTCFCRRTLDGSLSRFLRWSSALPPVCSPNVDNLLNYMSVGRATNFSRVKPRIFAISHRVIFPGSVRPTGPFSPRRGIVLRKPHVYYERFDSEKARASSPIIDWFRFVYPYCHIRLPFPRRIECPSQIPETERLARYITVQDGCRWRPTNMNHL